MTRMPALRTRPRVLKSLAAVTALGATFAVAGCRDKSTDASKYETVPVTRGVLTSRVTASGTVSAIVTVTVGAQVSGRIEKLFVDYNSKVKKGQLLAQIDPLLFQAALDSQVADVVAAKAQIESAVATAALDEANYKRDIELFKQKLLDQADFDTARFTLDVAKAAITNARGNLLTQEAQVRTARANLYYTKIISPIDGVVVSRSVDTGQTVVSSYQAPALFVIAQDLQKMQVDTNVAEADIGRIQVGQKASFTVDAYPGEHFKGRIRQMRVSPQTVQNVVTYDVVIDVDNPDLKLLPGMTANAEFVTSRREDVLKVSNAAFRFRPPADLLPPVEQRHRRGDGSHSEGKTAEGKAGEGKTGEVRLGPDKDARPPDRKNLWVLREGQPKMIPVQVGVTDGHETEIVSGDVQESDVVISAVNSDNNKGQAGMRRLF